MSEHAEQSSPGAPATPGKPVPVYHCPFCGDEGLRPSESASDAWACAACARVFSVRLLRLDGHGIPGRVDPSSVGALP